MNPEERASELGARLRHLAEFEKRLAPSGRVEQRVMQAWDARAARPVRRGRDLLFAGAGAAAAIVGAAWVWSTGAPAGSPAPVRTESPAAADAYLQWLDDDPASLQIFRLRTNPAELASMGLAVSDPDGDGIVEIELVVGPDGARRGARLLPASTREGF